MLITELCSLIGGLCLGFIIDFRSLLISTACSVYYITTAYYCLFNRHAFSDSESYMEAVGSSASAPPHIWFSDLQLGPGGCLSHAA